VRRVKGGGLGGERRRSLHWTRGHIINTQPEHIHIPRKGEWAMKRNTEEAFFRKRFKSIWRTHEMLFIWRPANWCYEKRKGK